MVCVVWCACGVWCVICVWCMMYGVLYVVWCVVYGMVCVWCVVCGVWYMVYGVWCKVALSAIFTSFLQSGKTCMHCNILSIITKLHVNS